MTQHRAPYTRTTVTSHNKPAILFVCYGNICRSPMALGLAKKLLGDTWRIDSAGTGAYTGRSASPAAVEVMKEYGLDISDHLTKNIHDLNPDEYDVIIALSTLVRDEILRDFPQVAPKVKLWEIPDPISGGIDAFRRCAGLIKDKLKELDSPCDAN